MGFVLFCLNYYNVLAQPSDATVKARAISDGSTFVRFEGSGNVHSNLTETWYIRVVTTKSKTEYPGINYINAIEYKYIKSGSNWVFDRTYNWWGQYEGIPNPNEAEAVAFVKKDLEKFLGGAYGDIVGDIGEIKLAEEPKWEWHTMKSVSFIMSTTYDRKMSSTEVSKVKQLYQVRFYADEPKGAWKSFISSKEGAPEIIATKTYSVAEVNAMPSLSDMKYKNEAKSIIASLPKVEVPKFSNAKEMIVYTHKMLRELSKEELHAYLLQTLSSSYFQENSKIVLNASGERKIKEVMDEAHGAKSSYKKQYCENPVIKTEQNGMMELWNKANDRKCRISVDKQGDTYKISDLELYVFATDADIARVEAATLCGGTIQTKVETAVGYNIGDPCEIMDKYKKWQKGTVKQKDTSFDNRYYVNVEQGTSGWYTTDQMRTSTNQKSSVTTENKTGNTATSTQTFKVGDKIMGNWKNKGKYYSGTVSAKIGDKYVIFYDDGDKETCTADQLKLK